LSSTDQRLLRKCPYPVWADRPASVSPYRSILAVMDPGNAESGVVDRIVVELSASLASREHTALHAVHSWRLYGESMLRSGRARISGTEVDMPGGTDPTGP
jgi:hypothetical protein